MQLTAADRVTLFRAGLGGILGIFVVLIAVGQVPERSWVVVAIAVPMLALDAVDGYVARRWDCVTARGAMFDGEVDAAVVLILSIAAAFTLGPWVLAIGLARYLYGAAGWLWPWLANPLPPHRFRKTVAAIQGIALVIVVAPITPPAVAVASALLAAALLATSFAGQTMEARRGVTQIGRGVT